MESEKKAFKNMTFGQKVEHIWEYYRLVVLGIVAAVALLIYMIVKIAIPDPEVLMGVVLVNSSPMSVTEPDTFQRYMEEKGINPKEEEISVNTNIYLDEMSNNSNAYQVMVAMILVGEVDLLIGNENTLEMLVAGDGLMPLDELMGKEWVENCSQDQLYILKDEETGADIVGGIWLKEDNPLARDGYYVGKVLVSVPYTASHKEMAVDVLKYLVE